MNLFYKNYVPKMAVAVLLLSGATLFQSCSKDQNDDPGQGGTQFNGKLTVQVLGIDDSQPIVSANPTGNKGRGIAKNPTPVKTVSFAAFDAKTTVEHDNLKETNPAIGYQPGTSANVNQQLAAAMKPNIKYRLLLYKNDGTFVSSTALSSGTAGVIDLEKGFTYRWYAVSYNTIDVVPDITDPLNPTLALPEGQDVLYAGGSFSTAANAPDGSNTTLAITFRHRLARIAIELNTMGMFANMSNATLAVSGVGVKKATMNLKTGALTDLTTYAQTINYSNFTDLLEGFGDAKVAYAYTADSTTALNVSVSVSNLALTLDDASTRSFATLLGATPAVFAFNFTPEMGKSYRTKMDLIESPLTIAGVRWARGNVYFNAGHNPYRFSHTNAPTQNLNTYFSFNSKTPGQYGVNNVAGDPCADVYPAGIWRQPTNAEFTSLTGVLGLGGETIIYGTNAGSGYFEYAAAGTGAPYPGTRVRFNFNGEGSNISLIEGVIEIGLGNNGTEAHLWSSSPVLAVPPLLSVGALYYTGTRTFGINSASVATGLLNISAIGIAVIESNFKNVRCVRS